MQRLISTLALLVYSAVPVVAFVLVRGSDRPVQAVAVDVAVAAIPMLVLASVTWRLVWPRWKLVAKLIVHPCFTWYAVEDPERYVAASKEMVGVSDGEPSTE